MSKKIISGFATQYPPGVIDETLEVTYLGVIWEVQVGRRNRFANKLIYYVDRALCPKCKAELMSESKLWRCPDIGCGFAKKRLPKFRGREREAVRSIAERDYKKMLQEQKK